MVRSVQGNDVFHSRMETEKEKVVTKRIRGHIHKKRGHFHKMIFLSGSLCSWGIRRTPERRQLDKRGSSIDLSPAPSYAVWVNG